VHHFYGTKEKLFVAAMRFPIVPSEVIPQVAGADPDRLGEAIVRTILGVWEREETRAQSIAVLRSAVTNERAATMVRGFVTSAILNVIATVAHGDEPEYRASLVASQVVGLGIVRYVIGIEPLAGASVEDVVAAVAPTLQRYLTGDVRA
jgi:hypothetical protein